MTMRIVRRRKVQDLILKALALYQGLIISVNEYEVDFIESMREKSQFGLVTTQEWILDGSLIEKLFTLALALRTHLLFNS